MPTIAERRAKAAAKRRAEGKIPFDEMPLVSPSPKLGSPRRSSSLAASAANEERFRGILKNRGVLKK